MPNGTQITFTADEEIFGSFKFNNEYIEKMLHNYAYLNVGLKLTFNGKDFISQNGLKDLLDANMSDEKLYPIVHIREDDIELAFTHTNAYGEEYYSFVNGQHTTQGGTHQAALRESYGKNSARILWKGIRPE